MIDNRLLDNNGINNSSFHQSHFSRMTGFPDNANTNIDKVCQFLDEGEFQHLLDLQEQDRAYDIYYAHGLELDDEFGDVYQIPRNGVDDDVYRFILICHMMAIRCSGTLPELVNFVSHSLQCSPTDVSLTTSRQLAKNTPKMITSPETIIINDINIENVPNDHLVPLLDDQLQLAVAADKRVQTVGFYTDISTKVFTGMGMRVKAKAVIPLKNEIDRNTTVNLQQNTGMGILTRATASIKLNK